LPSLDVSLRLVQRGWYRLRPIGLRGTTLTPRSKFQLTKWYADCVGHNGDAVILYCGIARWRAITLRYMSILEAAFGKQPSARYSLRKSPMPVERDTTIQWQSKSLGILGVWERLDPPFDMKLYETSEGEIKWQCLHPRSRATVNLGNGMVLQGLGYVERLDMTVVPWKLPIKELRWGRFLSDSDSLVWIDWRGPHSCRIVLQNGLLCGTPTIDEGEITLNGNIRLRISGGDVLRNGALGKTALAVIPSLRRLIPGKMLNIQECKWRSRAELRRGESSSSGWAIHEVVTWPE
jgi:hypothetical protein